MKNQTLATTGLLLGAGLGAARLVVSIRHHRENKHLGLARMHAHLLHDTAADQRLTAITNSDHYAELDPDERAQFMNANRWVTLWSLMLRLGFKSRANLRPVAEAFMSGPVGQAFWKSARTHRRITARDKHDEAFNDLMNDAYAEATSEPSAA
ncbi:MULTISPECIES: DUF6082 family protein [unclassified Streptomyces]|uniref:DUF6082 family protein n=1 Tax=unclassified Streptomyces TaxID=2593676 RepID=UPI00344F28BA